VVERDLRTHAVWLATIDGRPIATASTLTSDPMFWGISRTAPGICTVWRGVETYQEEGASFSVGSSFKLRALESNTFDSIAVSG
jgi:hypothetical protein